jgi:hypothetical protein
MFPVIRNVRGLAKSRSHLNIGLSPIFVCFLCALTQKTGALYRTIKGNGTFGYRGYK